MLRGRQIICISSIDWDFIWQGHQQIMSTLAEHENRVLFIENTGVRVPQLSDISRVHKRVGNWVRSRFGMRPERANLLIFSPVILPFPHMRWARRINAWVVLWSIRRWIADLRNEQPIVWTFLPTGLALDLVRKLRPVVSIYYCIDDFASSSLGAGGVRTTELEMLREVDLVFATSRKLAQRAVQFNRRVHLFPFGVDYGRFENMRKLGGPAPEEMRRLPRPIIGYIGGVHRWLDQQLLSEVARRIPTATFVFIGPIQTDVTLLAQCPNVHLLGPRHHDDLPRYMLSFDVGTVPYRLSDYTSHVYPTKLNEYLAMGMPVVATPLEEIKRFNDEHDNVIHIGNDAAAFAAAVEKALGVTDSSATARRIAIARENSWMSRIERMSELIEAAINGR